jgi:hypothetical protein
VTQEIVLGDAGDLPALVARDRVEGRAEALAAAALDLDEDDRAAIEGDQVDLAELARVVALQDRVALAAQMLLGGVLALRAEGLGSVQGRARSSPATCG